MTFRMIIGLNFQNWSLVVIRFHAATLEVDWNQNQFGAFLKECFKD